jgi:hypothetical protein
MICQIKANETREVCCGRGGGGGGSNSGETEQQRSPHGWDNFRCWESRLLPIRPPPPRMGLLPPSCFWFCMLLLPLLLLLLLLLLLVLVLLRLLPVLVLLLMLVLLLLLLPQPTNRPSGVASPQRRCNSSWKGTRTCGCAGQLCRLSRASSATR